MKALQEVKIFNSEHKVGDEISFQNGDGNVIKTQLKSMAFLGKGKKACVLIRDHRGAYSLSRVINGKNQNHPVAATSAPNTEVVPEKKEKRKYTKSVDVSKNSQSAFIALRDHLKDQVEINSTTKFRRLTVNKLFSKVSSPWGKLNSSEQFKIFLERADLKVVEEDTNYFTIGKK